MSVSDFYPRRMRVLDAAETREQLGSKPRLVVSRGEGSSLFIFVGDEVVQVRVEMLRRNKLRLSVTAPEEWSVLRHEHIGVARGNESPQMLDADSMSPGTMPPACDHGDVDESGELLTGDGR